MTENASCLFCKILAGSVPSRAVYSDDTFYAFHDIRPSAPVHVLIIPRRHIAALSECNEQDTFMLGKMMLLTIRLATELGIAWQAHPVSTGGFRTIINTGPDSAQEVYHLHTHLLGGAGPWSN